MPIVFDKQKSQFHLHNEKISYIMGLEHDKYLIQIYWGERIKDFLQDNPYPNVSRSSFSPNPSGLEQTNFSLDNALQEFPSQGTGDFRESIFEITYVEGTKATEFIYKNHEIFKGKKVLSGLPATYVIEEDEANTLEITLVDPNRNVKVILSYTIYKERSVLTKSLRYVNLSEEVITLNRALSACVDFPDNEFDMIHLSGAWAREKQIEKNALARGIHVIDSKRGASSVHHQPFTALMRKQATEHTGEVYGFHFVYSGNFTIRTEVDPFYQTRILVGINPHQFSWRLDTNEVFQTPEVVLVYAKEGLNEMSQTYHSLYTQRLARGVHQYQERPVLINNWETTYFDFDENKLLNLAQKSKEIGIELFVLDDGWFGNRNDDTTSLGDWFVDTKKLPSGLKNLAKRIKNKGLKFGLWFEPEMISEESELFKAHPDWHIHVPNYPMSKGRNQLILDFSRKEVREAIKQQMIQILDEVPIDYIKWDMNRNMTELGSKGLDQFSQMELPHRYILGLYELLEDMITRYPNILFENCSGGAGRFDPGMAYYMPQSWTSDNTDAIERIKIQYGTSFIFPPLMMCAQISECPNHQVGRVTDFKTRLDVSMSANFGVMLDLEKEKQADLEQLENRIAWYKEHRQLLQFGKFYRLISPYENNYASWMFVDEQKEEALFYFFKILGAASEKLVKVKPQGLNPDFIYRLDDKSYTGDELLKFGLYLNVEMLGDFQSKVLHLKRVKC